MVAGETGDYGLLVIVTLEGNLEGGDVIILLLKMEGNALALVHIQKQKHVQVFSDLKTFFFN